VGILQHARRNAPVRQAAAAAATPAGVSLLGNIATCTAERPRARRRRRGGCAGRLFCAWEYCNMRGGTLLCAKPPPRRPLLQAFRWSVILQHARRNGPVRLSAAAAAVGVSVGCWRNPFRAVHKGHGKALRLSPRGPFERQTLTSSKPREIVGLFGAGGGRHFLIHGYGCGVRVKFWESNRRWHNDWGGADENGRPSWLPPRQGRVISRLHP
jgi:hypothetical protein